jgi:hypothetical protein
MSSTYKVELVTLENHPKRGVAFLISRHRKVTAKDAFDDLDSNIERLLRTRFDAWIDGQINKKWYHGWTQSEFEGKYTKCFVFKCKGKRLHHRFYGFLYNPKPSNHSYQICVLVSHALKNEGETDETDLKEVEEIRTISAVQKSIDDYFREKP